MEKKIDSQGLNWSRDLHGPLALNQLKMTDCMEEKCLTDFNSVNFLLIQTEREKFG